METPKSELDVVFLLGKHWQYIKMNTKLESITLIDREFDARGRYAGEDCVIEIETVSGNFIRHGHDFGGCDVLICWRDGERHEFTQELAGDEYITTVKVEAGNGYAEYILDDPQEARRGYDPFEQAGISVIEIREVLEDRHY